MSRLFSTATPLLVALVLVIAGAIASTADAAPTMSPVVVTRLGRVQGFANEVEPGIFSFKGIPFAMPPVGELRFRAPQPLRPWNGTLNATKFSAGCMALCPLSAFPRPDIMCPKNVSEDCLYLNVYTPSLSPNSNLPVLVWFYGGNAVYGSGGVTLYDGSDMAKKQNVVFVTMNYRLGLFSSLYTGGAIRGNLQIKDQRAVLQWIRDNIASFGGNPNLVTITGQSFGGFSVTTHMTAPRSWPLFHRAISMSNPLGLMAMTPELALQLADVILKNVSCPNDGSANMEKCLRAIPAEKLLTAQHDHKVWTLMPKDMLMIMMPWVPVVDGDELPYQPSTALGNGNFNKVPFMPTTVANESVQFIYDIFNAPLSAIGLDLFLDFALGNMTLKKNVIAQYGPIPPIPDERMWISPTVTDMLFYCPWRWAGRKMAAAGGTVYQYVFDFIATWTSWVFAKNMPWCVGVVCHAADVPMIFFPLAAIKAAGLPTPSPAPPAELQLVRTMQTAWGNFARTGNPNSPIPLQFGHFPRFLSDAVEVNMSTPVGILNNYRNRYCDFWDQQGPMTNPYKRF